MDRMIIEWASPGGRALFAQAFSFMLRQAESISSSAASCDLAPVMRWLRGLRNKYVFIAGGALLQWCVAGRWVLCLGRSNTDTVDPWQRCECDKKLRKGTELEYTACRAMSLVVTPPSLKRTWRRVSVWSRDLATLCQTRVAAMRCSGGKKESMSFVSSTVARTCSVADVGIIKAFVSVFS